MIRLLISDLDGTLLNRAGTIPEANLTAIRSFVSEGGCFVVATGRTKETARFVTDHLIPGPVILYNGSCIMDLRDGRVLWDISMDGNVFRPLLKELMETFPDICTEVYGYGPVMLVNPKATEDPFIQNEGQPFEVRDLSDTPDRWMKIMLVGEPERLAEVERWLDERKAVFPPFHGFYSHQVLYELLIPEANKGVAAKRLMEILNLKKDEVAAIGDHMNDLEMLSAVGHPLTPADAHPSAKAVAEVLSATCDEGAVAAAIERIRMINRAEKENK